MFEFKIRKKNFCPYPIFSESDKFRYSLLTNFCRTSHQSTTNGNISGHVAMYSPIWSMGRSSWVWIGWISNQIMILHIWVDLDGFLLDWSLHYLFVVNTLQRKKRCNLELTLDPCFCSELLMAHDSLLLRFGNSARNAVLTDIQFYVTNGFLGVGDYGVRNINDNIAKEAGWATSNIM